MTKRQWKLLVTEAGKYGTDAGKNAGSWVIDGNTDDETKRRIIKGYDDGDPEIMDMQPAPLSGEWADEPTPKSLMTELDVECEPEEESELCDAYEEAFSAAYWDEVISLCRD